MAHPRIRRARPGDGPATHAVFLAAVREGAAGHYTEAERRAWAPSDTPHEDWEPRLLAQITFVAVAKGRIVGVMAMGEDGHIDLAYVAPAWMGRGVADALYTELRAEAARSGLPALTVEASHLARSFFARHRWREEARQDVIRNGVALTNFRMRLELDQAPAPSQRS